MTKDPRKAIQFVARRAASDAAKRVGWPSGAPHRTDIMGFMIWVLADDHMNYLTREEYDALAVEREDARACIRSRAEAVSS